MRVVRRQPLCLPFETVGLKRKWNSDEPEIMHEISVKKLKTLYEGMKNIRPHVGQRMFRLEQRKLSN